MQFDRGVVGARLVRSNRTEPASPSSSDRATVPAENVLSVLSVVSTNAARELVITSTLTNPSDASIASAL
jgi:hypothetical protein